MGVRGVSTVHASPLQQGQHLHRSGRRSSPHWATSCMRRPLGSHRFSHDLMREVVYPELGAVRRQVLHQRALARLSTEGALASELAYHALAAGEAKEAYGYSVQAGDEAVAVFAVADGIVYYEQARAFLQEHVQQGMPEASEGERLYVHLGQAYVFQNDWGQAQEAPEQPLAYGKQ